MVFLIAECLASSGIAAVACVNRRQALSHRQISYIGQRWAEDSDFQRCISFGEMTLHDGTGQIFNVFTRQTMMK